MKPIFLLNSNTSEAGKDKVGGKGSAVLELAKSNFPIPLTACIPCSVYNSFLEANNIRERIQLEINRKNLSDSRWEEIWDISLRIRSLFLTASLPEKIELELIDFIDRVFAGNPLALRSSSPDEDNHNSSFAGLHASYLNIRGKVDLIMHVKKIWASLWSDRALLYRQELGLEVENSAMAVIIQELVNSDYSGIVFSQSPSDTSQMIIESVYGLNQGLVDGEVEPDRWIINRSNQKVLSFTPAEKRENTMVPSENGVELILLDRTRAEKPPLDKKTIPIIRDYALSLEEHFDCPQDVEWTCAGSQFFILQTRPVTARQKGDAGDKRSWYLSLTRSYSNLCKLRVEIEEKFLPEMEKEAERLSKIDIYCLSDKKLAHELARRTAINDKWVKIYWDEFIPFAHGIRLFGEIYNDLLTPESPYEFVTLLSGGRLLSTERNKLLVRLAARLRANPEIRGQLLTTRLSDIEDQVFRSIYNELEKKFGNPFNLYNLTGAPEEQAEKKLTAVIFQYADMPETSKPFTEGQRKTLENRFLKMMGSSGHPFTGQDILELGRASYRLRDDDNIILGKIEQQVETAVREARVRLVKRGVSWAPELQAGEIIPLLTARNTRESPPLRQHQKAVAKKSRLLARQLVGQPASPGIAKAKARIIDSHMKFENFEKGEILVVDAIDPNMTFIAPLASAIVERRGGMLIHGAIIAREYGIPCITGIHMATDLIKTGDTITVDGYLGIVTINH